ncbi:MAG: pyridoxamine 5'-phosphate oxidase family protein [Desulfobacterales bacterium]|jgi:nitroimidazol reductase NimA-like FMN-containing flavoprotein (pyridoxamine 5'-phosphate oxidase superfamily)
MIEKMKSLVRQQDMCVLATVGSQKPHCSLMAYLTEDACSDIYLVTRRNSQKFINLSQNTAVSLLIDTRGNQERGRIQAVTVAGDYVPIDEEALKERIHKKFLSAHPHLEDLINHPETEILRIRIRSFLLLDGPTEAYFEIF